jgi:hypothetical protein
MSRLSAVSVVLWAFLISVSGFAQSSYTFESFVLSTAPSGTGTQVNLSNSRIVFCEPDGLIGTLCPLLPPAQGNVVFDGELPAVNSDLAALGWFPVDTMTVNDAGPPLTIFTNTWAILGCITAATPSGSGIDMTVTHEQVEAHMHCGDDGTLGALCGALSPGDCALFRGTFPAPGSHLFAVNLLDLRSVQADNASTSPPPPPPPCVDCDGR